MRIDPGDPQPWVEVEPFGPNQGTERICAGFAVRCKHCGGISSAFLPLIVRKPDTIARLVELHNKCPPRAA